MVSFVNDPKKVNHEDSDTVKREERAQNNQRPQPRPDGTYEIGTFTQGSLERGELTQKVCA
ncbi:hypothetical protein AUK41_02430 [Candidatus Berkelbacteria bacterium CG2_30_43_20]|uniref:Uncharacterized protein n=1 Tax=Candidatus Berkelbacteria bacterium CG10_big_fil_rev_8_21_14_0_10_43_14 TaxID=1974515 RepID=A0A2M6R8G5_9BACT|nr:MAG: hypothetical protein AUK41_02430 [Candidatus Berkelbacteria bacterium CG2_30_43_20]PIS06888.1 MAG: hypothetical protein COT79_02195 [Candidatus Berkelbacteria bacterium CG10_big_fil_rev_8_21_14_0_10_43_14]